MTKDIAGVVRDFFGVSSAKPYRGNDTTLGTFSTVGSGRSGRLKPGDPDDFLKLLEQRVNKMPSRPRPRRAPGRSSKRKAPRGKKRTIKRKAPIRKSTKRKKRKISPKSVKLTTGTARKRIHDHTSQGRNHAQYQSFSSIGRKENVMDIVAKAMILHYMHRVGDFRATEDVVPVGNVAAATDANPVNSTWTSMIIKFTFPGIQSDVDDSSITVTGGAQSVTQMTTSLAGDLFTQAKAGRRVAQVTMFTTDSAGHTMCVLNDTNAGRNIIEFASSAQMKLQNVTLADSTDTSGDKCSVMNIHRNPLDGQVYTFKNAVPKLKHGYMLSKTQGEQDLLRTLQFAFNVTSAAGVSDANLASAGDEWNSPPRTMSTMFMNAKGKSPCAIHPGGHKTFYQKEFYSGPINSFFDRYIPSVSGASTGFGETVPPGGSCMMVGLKPKYRTSTTEDIKLEIEHTYVYQSRMTKAKMSPMPMITKLI